MSSRPSGSPEGSLDAAAADGGIKATGPLRHSLPFTLVIPVLNEENAIASTLDAIAAMLDADSDPHEIIVVDDGSSDRSASLLASRADIQVIRHPETRGYGASLKSGIAAARYPLIAVMDADGTYPASAIAGLVRACANLDMVVGSRTGERVHPTPLRTTVKWFLRQFAQSITRAPIPDLNSGLRVFWKDLSERHLNLLPSGFSFTTTITVASLAEGASVRFVPIDYMARIGHSKLLPIRDTARIVKQLVRIGWIFAPSRTSLWFAAPVFAGLLFFWATGRVSVANFGLAELVAAAFGASVLALGAVLEYQLGRRADPWKPRAGRGSTP